MAAYFDFEHKKPHINTDDVYVKSGKVKDTQLVLNYSVDINPLSISLSGLNNYSSICSAEFNNNNLIFQRNLPELENIVVNLSTLDKHITNIQKSSNSKILALYFNDNTYISVDTTDFTKNFFLSNIQLSNDNKLYFKHNTNDIHIDPVDLTKFDKYLNNANIDKVNKKIQYLYNDNTCAFEINTDDINYELTSGNVANNKLTLKFTNNKQDVEIDFSSLNYNVLSDMQFYATDEKSILSMAQAIEQIVTAFGGNRQPTYSG